MQKLSRNLKKLYKIHPQATMKSSWPRLGAFLWKALKENFISSKIRPERKPFMDFKIPNFLPAVDEINPQKNSSLWYSIFIKEGNT